MMALLTIQKYAWRSYSSSDGKASALAPGAAGPWYKSATSNGRLAAAVRGFVGALDMR
jgi:hypothetical protein